MPAPSCPKCGCPPRTEIRVARVRIDFRTRRLVRGQIVETTEEHPAAYECGGGHVWSVETRKEPKETP